MNGCYSRKGIYIVPFLGRDQIFGKKLKEKKGPSLFGTVPRWRHSQSIPAPVVQVGFVDLEQTEFRSDSFLVSQISNSHGRQRTAHSTNSPQ
jgi:hypothetical protein